MLALASFLGRGQQRRIKSAYRQTTVELLVQNYLILWLFDTYWCRKEYISLGTSLGYIRAIYSLFAACVSRNFFQICRRYCLCLPQYIYQLHKNMTQSSEFVVSHVALSPKPFTHFCAYKKKILKIEYFVFSTCCFYYCKGNTKE